MSGAGRAEIEALSASGAEPIGGSCVLFVVTTPIAEHLAPGAWPEVRETIMRSLFLGAAGAASLLTTGLAAAPVSAEPPAQLIFAVDRSGGQPPLIDAQFIFGGRSFCWYTGGWRGEGFYWCGYAWRSGMGWGGGRGWHGWRGGYANGYRGGPVHARGGYHAPIHRAPPGVVNRVHPGQARPAGPAHDGGDRHPG